MTILLLLYILQEHIIYSSKLLNNHAQEELYIVPITFGECKKEFIAEEQFTNQDLTLNNVS